ADRFAALVSRLAITEEFLFCFTGTSEEREYVQRVINLTHVTGRCINVAGRLTIPELCALLEQSVLYIGNDSGPLHLATALGVPTVGLFGPESPVFYGPLGDRHTSIYRRLPCSPCMNVYAAKSFRCPYNARCMKEIQVDEVFDALPVLEEAE
ncbi:MAG TPA: glycosyltransferase family 9 protein, partial [Bacteroidota bacterium]|nr:glycosyltransferase family 9 protein [Bacteroidota bacterium]